MNQEYVNIIDFVLAIMLLSHVIHQMYSTKRAVQRLRRLSESTKGVRMGYFRLLCNSLFGAEAMGWTKITATTLLFISFGLLILHGSFFGLVGCLTVGFMGSVKAYYSVCYKHNRI